MKLRALTALVVAGALTGCDAGPRLTAEQWDALETREIDGQRDEVLRAVAAVVLDQGYFYLASDHSAGVLTAERIPLDLEDAFRRTGGMKGYAPGATLSVWVRQTGPGRCALRLQRRAAGEGVFGRERLDDREGVSEFAVAVQRRMLGGEAAPLRPQADTRKGLP